MDRDDNNKGRQKIADKKAADKKIAERKSKKALARVRRTLRKKDTLEGEAALSEWEDEFVDSLEERLEEFGAAFADPQKGAATEALSYRQLAKLKEVEKKARGKATKPLKRSSFKPKKPFSQKKSQPPRGGAGTDAYENIPPETLPSPAPKPRSAPTMRPSGPPSLQVISGGKKNN